MTTLTNTAIDALQAGGLLRDDKVPGLQVRRTATGVSFLYYYRTRQGRERRPKVGSYPVVSISQARDIARAWAVLVAGGGDPAGDDKAARDDPTMADLWLLAKREHYDQPDTKRWHREAASMWARHIKARLGARRVREIAYADVKAVHTALKAKPVQANRVVAVLSKMFNIAERHAWRPDGSNPCQHVERFPERKRKRYAKPAEITTIGPILERHAAADPAGVAFLYCLVFSGARPTEVGRASPNQLERVVRPDGTVCGVLRLKEAKTGPRDVFLPAQVMAVLDRLPADRKSLAGRVTTPNKLWRTIRAEAGCPDLWARDWRRTFGTVALTGGVTLGQVGELLGHASPQTTKLYAKLLEDGAHTAAASTATRLEEMLKAG